MFWGLTSRHQTLLQVPFPAEPFHQPAQPNCFVVVVLYCLKDSFYFNYVCVGYVHMSVGDHRDKKRALDSLELKLATVLSHLTWVLGTEFEFSARAIGVCPSLFLVADKTLTNLG